MTPAVTQKLFGEIAPKFADRAGGLHTNHPRWHPRGRPAQSRHPRNRRLRTEEKRKKKKKTRRKKPAEAAKANGAEPQIWAGDCQLLTEIQKPASNFEAGLLFLHFAAETLLSRIP